MSISDIKNMPLQERMRLMEVLLDSFRNDEENIKSPLWHKEVLEKRAEMITQDNVKTYTLEELKAKR